MKKFYIPFKDLSQRAWLNLAIAAAISFHVIISGYTLLNLNLCRNYGGDYCAYWSAGKIASDFGYSSIYDLKILTQVQKDVFGVDKNQNIQTFGIMYPPIFLVPFQVLAFLPLPISYVLWNSINLTLFILYLRFFSKQIANNPISPQFLILAIVSLPFYINLFEGQVNVFLVICIGEFIRAINNHYRFSAGLWLGGLLIKPQLLILILPFFLIQRSKKIIFGFTVSGLVVLAFSYILVGNKGFLNMFDLIFRAAQGDLASHPAVMINWRMLGWHIATISSSTIGSITTIIGSLLTLGAVFVCFRNNISQNENKFLLATFGIFSATLAITWHSHFHTALILIPFFLYFLSNDNFNLRLYSVWIFIPIVIQFFFYIQTGLVFLGVPQPLVTQIMKFEEGFRGLVLNLVIIGWTIMQNSKINDGEKMKKALPEN